MASDQPLHLSQISLSCHSINLHFSTLNTAIVLQTLSPHHLFTTSWKPCQRNSRLHRLITLLSEMEIICAVLGGMKATGYSFIHSVFKKYLLSTSGPLQRYANVEHSNETCLKPKWLKQRSNHLRIHLANGTHKINRCKAQMLIDTIQSYGGFMLRG